MKRLKNYYANIMLTSIGIPFYNNFERADKLIESILSNTDGFTYGEDFLIVLCDDGTKNTEMVERMREVSKKYETGYVRHEKNRGIPAAWNTLTKYSESKYQILLNDDMDITNGDWLRCFMFFMENNKLVGSVGFPLIHIDMSTNKPIDGKSFDDFSRWAPFPPYVGSPVGNAFGFPKEAWKKIRNVDNSIGFWEDLVSFSEEIFFGFRLWELGYHNYMLPYPPILNLGGGQTFASNPNLNVRKPSDYLPVQEYLDKLLKYKPKHHIINSFGEVSRMDYSRAQFAKYYNCHDYWDNPYKEVHERIVTPKPAQKVKWLNRNLNIEEAMIDNSGVVK